MTRILFSLVLILFATEYSHALNMELGASYNYKKTIFNAQNYSDSESTTGSVSLYMWERIALELSYTSSTNVKQEQANDTAIPRTTTMYADIYGADLIYVFADRKARFQPYIKGGAAYIRKKVVIQDQGNVAQDIELPAGTAPSYGAGIKFFLTESFAIKASYDVVRTPVDANTHADDVMTRIGLSWML